MTTLINVLSGPAWQQILLTLAHSLWQGAVLALLLAAVLSRIAGGRPQARYLASLTCLAALVVSSLITWSVLDLPPSLALSPPIAADQTSNPMSAAIDTTLIPLSPKPTHAEAAAAPPSTGLGINLWTAVSAICTAVWLVGVVVMLARMAWLVTGARRLATRPPLTDPRVLDLVEALRRRLGILRSIRVVDAATIGPAVLGILRPVLLLPAAIISELPADCLEAILAHELAHIRRHDYLVNLVQMLIEAALFFNPAVWWISRQIRREREACCDALAVGITGRPLSYAEALTAWLERMHAGRFSPATAGWLGQGGHGTVLDRVRRLVIAGYRPELRGSWTALAGGLAISLLVLTALWTGTRASVALAAEILSPAERIEQLAKERDAVRPLISNPDPNGRATLAGTVRTTDGQPVPARLDATVCSQGENSSYCETVSLSVPNFSVQVHCGKTSVSVSGDGYAPTLLRSLRTIPGETLDGLDVVLQPGFSSYIRVVDAAGTPVVGALATARLSDPAGRSWDWKSDDQGIIAADHLADAAYLVTLAAKGFQTLRPAPFKFQPGETIIQTLTPAALTDGIVVSPAGEPIAGAAIRCITQVRPGISDISGANGPVLATTDGNGRFSLDSLDDNTWYAMLVETPAGGRQFFPGVEAGKSGLRWTVGPPLGITGRIVGDLTQLDSHQGIPRISFSQNVDFKSPGHTSYNNPLRSGTAVVETVDGEQRFQIADLMPGKLTITVGGQRFDFDLNEPTTDVTIDLKEKPTKLVTRRVVLRFVGADAGLSPQGNVAISMTKSSPVASELSNVTINNGAVEFDAFVPGKVAYRMKNVVGYWFNDGVLDVPVGAEPLEHDVPVVAAGAIRGKLVNADGTPPAGNVQVGVQSIEKPPTVNVEPIAINNIPVDSSGEFFVSPLPLGGVYAVRASRGFENVLSEPVRVDADNPSPTVEVRFSPTRSASGHVWDFKARPILGMPVTLQYRSSPIQASYAPPHQTDRGGRFQFDGLSIGTGEYSVNIVPRRGFEPAEVRLPLNGKPIDIQLKSGHVIDGRLLDATTGEPLAGVEVYAHPIAWSAPMPYRYEAEEPTTDADGRFRFSTLPEGEFCIYTIIVGVPFSPTDPNNTFKTGETVELRVTLPEKK